MVMMLLNIFVFCVCAYLQIHNFKKIATKNYTLFVASFKTCPKNTMNVLFMAESLSKKPQGFLDIGTSLLASLFNVALFHVVLKAEVHECLCRLEFVCQSVNGRCAHGNRRDRAETCP